MALSFVIDMDTICRRAALAVSIGCVCRAKGGLALQGLLPTVVETLIAVARQSSGLVAFWTVHGLWLTANASGLSFISHVKASPGQLAHCLLDKIITFIMLM